MRQIARTNVPSRSSLIRRGVAQQPVGVGSTPKISTKAAFEKGQSLIDADSKVEAPMPIVVPPKVTEDAFVDALTAVMTGNVELSDDDDLSSIASLSTIDSHASTMLLGESGNAAALTSTEGNLSVAFGELFFSLDKKDSATRLPPPATRTAVASSGTSSKQTNKETNSHSLLTKQTKPTKAAAFCEEKKDDDGSSSEPRRRRGGEYVRNVIAEQAREADKEGLFEMGQGLFRMGERLLAQGKVEEARETLARAQTFQKHSIRLVTKRMAHNMHQQGLKHCDRGDKFLSIVLLGVAETLKHRPTPANLQLGTRVHAGYKQVCPKTREFRESRKEIDRCLKTIEEEALPLAHTMRAYAKSIRMSAAADAA